MKTLNLKRRIIPRALRVTAATTLVSLAARAGDFLF